MPTIRFMLPNGSEQVLDAPASSTAMQVATGAGLSGIVADCGGSAMCPTAHVYIRQS